MTNSYSGSSDDDIRAFLNRDNETRVKDYVKNIFQSIGINPSILDTAPIRKHPTGRPSFYQPGSSPYISIEEGAYDPHTLFHESLHHLQYSLRGKDSEELKRLISENRADPGFTNYPGGNPSLHHQYGSNDALATYADYSPATTGGNPHKPLSQLFRSDVPQSYSMEDLFKYRDVIPAPVADFLKNKFPITEGIGITEQEPLLKPKDSNAPLDEVLASLKQLQQGWNRGS